MKYIVTGDIHGDINRLSPDLHPQIKGNTVIVLGDFGIVWNSIDLAEQKLSTIARFDTQILFVDGNHEGFELLKRYPYEEWNGGMTSRLSPNVRHLHRGQIFTLENGEKIFTMGGADSTDKFWRQPHISWWADETISRNDFKIGGFNMLKHSNRVDYVLTHDVPANLIDEIYPNGNSFDSSRSEEYLQMIDERVEYKIWYAGHHHINLNIRNKYQLLYEEYVELGNFCKE